MDPDDRRVFGYRRRLRHVLHVSKVRQPIEIGRKDDEVSEWGRDLNSMNECDALVGQRLFKLAVVADIAVVCQRHCAQSPLLTGSDVVAVADMRATRRRVRVRVQIDVHST
jgi:hypothetical protein